MFFIKIFDIMLMVIIMNEKFIKTIKELLPYVITIIIVLLFKHFFFAPIRVNGDSMYSTLKNNDIMILDKVHYRHNDIKRFDIVVVDADYELLIKRVIGLPGEKIEVKNNKLYINGKYVKQDFKYKTTEDFTYKVKKGEYYVMGDNRTNSLDSRYFGAFKRNKIIGKTNYTVFPFSRFGKKE